MMNTAYALNAWCAKKIYAIEHVKYAKTICSHQQKQQKDATKELYSAKFYVFRNRHRLRKTQEDSGRLSTSKNSTITVK